MYYIIDRIEGEFAVCEESKTGKMREILISELPVNIKEGSILKFENGKYVIDFNEQEKRKKDIKEKVKNAWKN